MRILPGYPLLQLEHLQCSMYSFLHNAKKQADEGIDYYHLYILLKDYYRVRLIAGFGLQDHLDDRGYVEKDYQAEMYETLGDCERLFEDFPEEFFGGMLKNIDPKEFTNPENWSSGEDDEQTPMWEEFFDLACVIEALSDLMISNEVNRKTIEGLRDTFKEGEKVFLSLVPSWKKTGEEWFMGGTDLCISWQPDDGEGEDQKYYNCTNFVRKPKPLLENREWDKVQAYLFYHNTMSGVFPDSKQPPESLLKAQARFSLYGTTNFDLGLFNKIPSPLFYFLQRWDKEKNNGSSY